MPPSFHIWRYPMRNLKTVEKKVRAILEKNEDFPIFIMEVQYEQRRKKVRSVSKS